MFHGLVCQINGKLLKTAYADTYSLMILHNYNYFTRGYKVADVRRAPLLYKNENKRA